MCSFALDRSRRRCDCRSRPTSMKAACGRRMACASRGPASGGRSCCEARARSCRSRRSPSFDTPVQVWDWSRDGRSLLIGRKSNDHGDDLWIQPPTEGAAAQPYVTAPFDQAYGAFSPDGRSIAYASNESGPVRYLPRHVSEARRARAADDGRRHRAALERGRPRAVLQARVRRFTRSCLDGLDSHDRSRGCLMPARRFARIDVSRDGRFLINVPARAITRTITLVNHWQPQTGHGITETRKDN